MATLPSDNNRTGSAKKIAQGTPSGKTQAGRSRATIAQVAAVAGVGLSTVSRVIRNAPSVSEETRKKVEDAVQKTGYQVDSVARSLRNNGNLDLIALIVPDIGDPYFADIYMNLQRSALSRGESLLVGSHAEDFSMQSDLLHQMSVYRPTAIVLVPAPGTTAGEIVPLQDQGIPVVILDRPVLASGADTVLAENELGAELLVNSLIERGSENIGIVSLPRTIWTQARRYEAVLQALGRRGIQPVAAIEEPALTAPTGAAFGSLFSHEVDSVIALSVPPAMGVMRREQMDGIDPIRIGCFDRHPWFDLVQSEIVTVSQNPDEVAEQVDYHIKRRREDLHASAITSVLSFRLDGMGATRRE